MTKLESSNPRKWVLYGPPETGKSEFWTQLRTPILVIDSDHRAEEVAHLVHGDVYTLCDNPQDAHDARAIARLLDDFMPKHKDIATIVPDSLSAIIEPIIAKAQLDQLYAEDHSVSWKEKAFTMRFLQDNITKWGTDTLWIYHELQGKDHKGKNTNRMTLSATERARLSRSINVAMRSYVDKGQYGIQVVHARRGNAGFSLIDLAGHWAGMPELIEERIYGTREEGTQEGPPDIFTNLREAIQWAIAEGAYSEANTARDAFNNLMAMENPVSSRERRNFWVTYVTNIVEMSKSVVDS